MKPINKLLNNVDFKCLKCGEPIGKCDCWQKCACGWSYEKGKKCRNPIHRQTERK